jgi:hypothetical protein
LWGSYLTIALDVVIMLQIWWFKATAVAETLDNADATDDHFVKHL